ncbi:anti-Muellerian hormone type-2 receptor [Platysternon megacephalum]|uniref:Anti-Muellerian hormone type-2 receptor n=1 Tax=Platysternon megacephalum TaxID=55544 RepID=A0A4D9E9G6_9SAUR|nr:anti-Muellerian hormone type-2 receptor [Platysternon megacephalum]
MSMNRRPNTRYSQNGGYKTPPHDNSSRTWLEEVSPSEYLFVIYCMKQSSWCGLLHHLQSRECCQSYQGMAKASYNRKLAAHSKDICFLPKAPKLPKEGLRWQLARSPRAHQ